MPDPRFILLSLLSIGLSGLVLLTTNWLEQTDQTTPVAKNYFLNLFVHFYAEPLRTNVGLVAPEALFTCLIPTTTLILNEGYRRRNSFPRPALALFVGLSLALGAGTTTPLYLSCFHAKDARMPVGALAAAAHVLAVVSTCIVFVSIVRNRLKVFSVVLIFLWPAVTSFMSVTVETVMVLRRPASRFVAELPYVFAVGLGIVAHYRAVNALVLSEEGRAELLAQLDGNIAFCFMMVNVLMMVLAMNLWLLLHGGKKTDLHMKLLPLVTLLGPAAHLAIHGILYERSLRALKANKKE